MGETWDGELPEPTPTFCHYAYRDSMQNTSDFARDETPGTDIFAMSPPPVYRDKPRGRSRTRRSRSPEGRATRFSHRSYDAEYRQRDYPRNSFRRDGSREYFGRRNDDNCTYAQDFGQPDVHGMRTCPSQRRPTDFGREYLTPRHRVQNPKYHAEEEDRIKRGRTARYGRGRYKKPPGFVPGRTNRNNDHVPPVTPRFGGGDFIPYKFNRRPSIPVAPRAQEVISYDDEQMVDTAAGPATRSSQPPTAAAREPSPLDLDATEEIIAVSYTAPAKPREKINVFSAASSDLFQIAINEYGRLGDNEKLKKITHFMQYDWEYSEAAHLEIVKELEGMGRVGREFTRKAGLEVEGAADMAGGVMIGEMEGGGQVEPFHAETAQTEHFQNDPLQTDITETEYVQGTPGTTDQEKEDEAMFQEEEPQAFSPYGAMARDGPPPRTLTNTQKEKEDKLLYGKPGMNQVDSPRSVMACDGSVAAPSSPVAGARDGSWEDMVEYGDSQDELYCSGCGTFFTQTAAWGGHRCNTLK